MLDFGVPPCPRCTPTPATATAPAPLPSPAISLNSGCWVPPRPSPGANTILNTIVAETLMSSPTRLGGRRDFDGEIQRIIADVARTTAG